MLTSEDILERVQTPLALERNKVSLAFLFGSTVEGNAARDVDIAVLFDNYSFGAYQEVYEGLQASLKDRRLDLVVLNRSNARIKLQALLKGTLLFAAHQRTLSDFAVDALYEYEDYRYFKSEFTTYFRERILEGMSMAQKRLDRERVETYLSRLDETVGQLSRLANKYSAYEDFQSDVDTRELCVHYLRIAVESVLDVCRHFLAVKGVSLAEIDTVNIIELCGEKGLLDPNFARKIKGMAGMRNAIVHVYWRLDYQAIHRVLSEELGHFDEFARQVHDYLESDQQL